MWPDECLQFDIYIAFTGKIESMDDFGPDQSALAAVIDGVVCRPGRGPGVGDGTSERFRIRAVQPLGGDGRGRGGR